MKRAEKLAIDGGEPVLRDALPPRGLFDKREKAALDKLLDRAIEAGSAPGYNGPEEEAYCKEFSSFLGGGFADAVNSGTNAVYVALRALELPPFSEVIIPPITDPGGAMPVPLINCIPVVADAAPGSYNTGADQIAARITPRTSAILVAHISGEPVDMDPVLKLARQKSLPVVEDCAQAHGAIYRGRMVGTLGTVGAFSTMFGKHHCTGGQGGVVFTKSEDVYWKIRRHADRGKPFGLTAPGNVVAALNMNLSEIGACIGRVQLAKLPRIVAQRRKVAQRVLDGIKGLSAVFAAPPPRGAEPCYWFLKLSLRLDKLSVGKDQFCKALGAEIKVPVGPSYRHIPSEAPWFKDRRVFGVPGLPWTSPQYKGNPDKPMPTPNAIAATDASFNLHIHEGINLSQATLIAKAIAKVEAAYLKR